MVADLYWYEGAYQKNVQIFDHVLFDDTGHNLQFETVEIPRGFWRQAILTIEATTDNDIQKGVPNNDRLISVCLHPGSRGLSMIEIFRGTTFFTGILPTTIWFERDISHYLSLLEGRKPFGAKITTFDHSWILTITLKLSSGPQRYDVDISPVCYMTRVPAPGLYYSYDIKFPEAETNDMVLAVYASGHNIEEYEARTMLIWIDNIPVVHHLFKVPGIENDRNWIPGKEISPIYVRIPSLTGVHEIEFRIDVLEYWLVSMHIIGM